MISVKPRGGLRVPNPETGRPLPDAGMPVADSSYWRRRHAEGAVEIGPVEAEAPAGRVPAPKPAKKEITPEEGEQK